MRRERNMAQTKEQVKTPEKRLNKMDIINLSDAEFKTLVIRMLRELTEYSNNNNNKKFPRRNESYTSEINKNLQATHSLSLIHI